MTERPECAVTRQLVPELAAGTAAGDERADALAHLGRCLDCRRELAATTDLMDELLLLVPEEEPGTGFECSVLARLNEEDDAGAPVPSPAPAPTAPVAASAVPPGRPSRWSRLAWLPPPGRNRFTLLGVVAAATVALALLAAGLVWRATEDDRELAAAYRHTLEVAHGQGLSAAPLRTRKGTEIGTLFAYQGEPSWVYATFRSPPDPGNYQVHLLSKDGRCLALRPFEASTKAIAWGGKIPVRVSDIQSVAFIQSDTPVLTAHFG